MRPLKPLIASAAALAAAGIASAAPLTVTVTGIEARGGKLYVGVQTEAQFMKEDGVAGEIIDAPEAGSKTFTFDLPDGVYSVSIWHDFNANGVFDLTEAGPPADGWGAINGDTLRAAPTFDQVSLPISGDGASTSIMVFYPD